MVKHDFSVEQLVRQMFFRECGKSFTIECIIIAYETEKISKNSNRYRMKIVKNE